VGSNPTLSAKLLVGKSPVVRRIAPRPSTSAVPLSKMKAPSGAKGNITIKGET
jgi:hypothetical protein